MLKVFDYYCKDCGEQFEKFVKKDEGVKCPFCRSDNVERDLSSASFKVGGQGAYTNKMKV